MDNLKARIFNGSCRRHRLWIAIESNQPPLRRKPLKNESTMAAAAKSAVHVESIWTSNQGFRCFAAQNGKMDEGGHGLFLFLLSSSAAADDAPGKHCAGLPKFWKYFLWQKAGSEREVEILNGLRDGLRLGSSQACTIPELEMITPADKSCFAFKSSEFTQPRGDEYAPRTINLQFLSTAQH